MTQSEGKVYFWWHHILSIIATKIKICYCLLDTGGHSYIQYFMSLWFICQLDTKTYNYITKNSKIDPQNSKNGDNFFKISSNIYLKKYRIHWILSVFFLLNSKTVVVWTCSIFFKPRYLKIVSLLHIKLSLFGLQEKSVFFVMVVKIMKFGPFQLHLTPGPGWKSSPKCVVLVCSSYAKKITNRWREIGCNVWKVQSFWSIQKMFLGALNF